MANRWWDGDAAGGGMADVRLGFARAGQGGTENQSMAMVYAQEESDACLEGNVSPFVPSAVELLAITKDIPHEIDLHPHAISNLLSVAVFHILEAKTALELRKVIPKASFERGSASSKGPSPGKVALLGKGILRKGY